IRDGERLEQDVAPGTHTVTEGLTSGWDFASAECDDGDSSGNAATRTVTFRADAGEHVTCTVTNTRQPSTIKIVKQTEPDGIAQPFVFAASYNADGFTLADDQS